MFKKIEQKTLFDNETTTPAPIIPKKMESDTEIGQPGAVGDEELLTPDVEKIVIFYSNKTFKEYLPSE